MDMLLLKFDGCDLLVEDMETALRVKKFRAEIVELQQLALAALQNFNDRSLGEQLKLQSQQLKANFADKFVFGMPFDARSGELYALDKKIHFLALNLEKVDHE